MERVMNRDPSLSPIGVRCEERLCIGMGSRSCHLYLKHSGFAVDVFCAGLFHIEIDEIR